MLCLPAPSKVFCPQNSRLLSGLTVDGFCLGSYNQTFNGISPIGRRDKEIHHDDRQPERRV